MEGKSSNGVGYPRSPSSRGAGIFLSYRRSDLVARVGRLYDRLVDRFGENHEIFRDIDAIRPGENFLDEIDRALIQCRVFIAVIGPTWLTVTDETGQRRLDDPDDFVRYELAKALHNSECAVLPVLRGTEMPAPEDLPEVLQPLAFLQAIEMDDEEGRYFAFDAQQVVDAVARLLDEGLSDVKSDIIISTPNLFVQPGHSSQTAVVLHNIASNASDISLSCDGPDWARLQHSTEHTTAAGELRSALVASPPRTPDLPPRMWPYTVEAYDQRRELLLARAHGNITTEAFQDTQVNLAPASVKVHRAAQLGLTVTNGGNADLHGHVLATADNLDVEAPREITLGPGATKTYPVNAKSRKRRALGRSANHALTVTVTVDDDPHPHVQHATIRQRPFIPTKLAGLMAAILIVPLGFGLWQLIGRTDFVACMVPVGGAVNTSEFNTETWEGLQELEDELGIQIDSYEWEDEDPESTLMTLAADGQCDVVISVTEFLRKATLDVAAQYPRQDFAIVNTQLDVPTPPSNVKPIVFDRAQGAFLAGYLAAATSENGTVATLGYTRENCSVTVPMAAFARGVEQYNDEHDPDVEVLNAFVPPEFSWSAASASERQAKVRELTQELIDKDDADVVMAVTGGAGVGAAEAAANSDNVRIVWFDHPGNSGDDILDQANRSALLASVVKDITNGVKDAVTEIAESEFDSEEYWGTLQNDRVSLEISASADHVPSDLRAELDALESVAAEEAQPAGETRCSS